MAANATAERFGKFRLLQRIGEGGMGVVYRAEMDGYPHPVVIKRARAELRHPLVARMGHQEAKLGALLQHPCLVPVLDAGEIDGQLYIVFEYVDGYDLSQIGERAIRLGRRVPIAVACHIAHQAAEALDFAHTLRDASGRPLPIVHRDVSPSNLMVTGEGAVKLLDFGIAKMAQQEPTRPGEPNGKMAYLSPEQAEGRVVDARSDLFSLGIVFMELLLQRRLFRGSGDFDTLRRVREAIVPSASQLRDDVDDELDALLRKLLARQPDDRFGSARELADALASRVGEGREATRAFLQELAPIERRATHDIVAAPEATETQPHNGPLLIGPAEFSSGVPRWRQYLDRLPEGMSSFPEYTMKVAIVQNFLKFFGAPPMPADAPEAVHEFVRNPPPVSSYMSGVLARVFLLCLSDALQIDDATYVQRAYECNKELISGPLYRVLFAVISTERLLRNAKSRWGAFHHDVELAVPRSGEGFATTTFTWPAGLETMLVLHMHVGGVRAGLEAVGARNVTTELRVVGAGEAHCDFAWDP